LALGLRVPMRASRARMLRAEGGEASEEALSGARSRVGGAVRSSVTSRV
jgi:hypothetical protein